MKGNHTELAGPTLRFSLPEQPWGLENLPPGIRHFLERISLEGERTDKQQPGPVPELRAASEDTAICHYNRLPPQPSGVLSAPTDRDLQKEQGKSK